MTLPIIDIPQLTKWIVYDSNNNAYELPLTLTPEPGSFFPGVDSTPYSPPGSDNIFYYGDNQPVAQHLVLGNGYVEGTIEIGRQIWETLKEIKDKVRSCVRLEAKNDVIIASWDVVENHSSVINEQRIKPFAYLFSVKFAVTSLEPGFSTPNINSNLITASFLGVGVRSYDGDITVNLSNLGLTNAELLNADVFVAVVQALGQPWSLGVLPNGWSQLAGNNEFKVFKFSINSTTLQGFPSLSNSYQVPLNLPLDSNNPLGTQYHIQVIVVKKTYNVLNYSSPQIIAGSETNQQITYSYNTYGIYPNTTYIFIISFVFAPDLSTVGNNAGSFHPKNYQINQGSAQETAIILSLNLQGVGEAYSINQLGPLNTISHEFNTVVNNFDKFIFLTLLEPS